MALNQPAPRFTLKTIASKRTIRLSDYGGRPVVLLFVDPNTGRATREVVVAIRRRIPDFAQLPILTVVDLHIVPKLLRGTAERFMESAYRSAAAEVPSVYDPADHLMLLPDWTGELARAYGVTNVSREIFLFIISPDGVIDRSYQGPSPAVKAIEYLEKYFPSV